MSATGVRRADLARFGRQHVRNGKLTFTQHKGRQRNPKQLTLPILPALQRIINASPCGDLTFLVNDYKRPFTDAGFGNWFADRCKEAKVPGRAQPIKRSSRSPRCTCSKRANKTSQICVPPIGSVGLFWKRMLKNQSSFSEMVPRRGLEPPRLAALVPETSASTNSATWAWCDRSLRDT